MKESFTGHLDMAKYQIVETSGKLVLYHLVLPNQSESTRRHGMTRHGMTRDGMTRDGMTRDGMTRDGMTRYGSAWHDSMHTTA